MPRLLRVISGIEWVSRSVKGNRVRLPITMVILKKILETKKALLASKKETTEFYSLENYDMASAVYALGLCAALRPSELAVRHTGTGVVSAPLLIEDINFEIEKGTDTPLSSVLMLPKRKNDQFGEKSDVAFGKTGDAEACGVINVFRWIQKRKEMGEVITPKSYLFPIKTEKGEIAPLTYELLTASMKKDLQAAGYDADCYNGHSFRIGAATTMAMNGVPEYIIKDMGGWARNSAAFNTYVRRTPREVRQSMSVFLTRPYVPTDGSQIGSWNVEERV